MRGRCSVEKSDFILSNLLTEIIKLSIASLAAAYLYTLQANPYWWLLPLVGYGGYQLGKWRYTRKPQLHFLPDALPQNRPAFLGDFVYAGMLWYAWIPQRDSYRNNLSQLCGIPAERIAPEVSGHPFCPRCRTELVESSFFFLHIFHCPLENCGFTARCMRAGHQLYHAAEKVAVKKFEDGSLTMRKP